MLVNSNDTVNSDDYKEQQICGIQGACQRLQTVTRVKNRTLDIWFSALPTGPQILAMVSKINVMDFSMNYHHGIALSYDI